MKHKKTAEQSKQINLKSYIQNLNLGFSKDRTTKTKLKKNMRYRKKKKKTRETDQTKIKAFERKLKKQIEILREKKRSVAAQRR